MLVQLTPEQRLTRFNRTDPNRIWGRFHRELRIGMAVALGQASEMEALQVIAGQDQDAGAMPAPAPVAAPRRIVLDENQPRRP